MTAKHPHLLAQAAGIITCLLALLSATGCGSGPEFRIDGTVEGLGTQNLTLVYYDNDAVQQVNAPAVDSRFSMIGRTGSPTLVWVYNNTGTLLGRLIVEGGDAVEATFSINNPLDIRVKGNDDAVLLAKFMRDNATLLNRVTSTASTSTGRHRAGTATATQADYEALNQAVESFVRKNRKSVAAAVVLSEFYNPAWSAQAKATELLELIPADYRPNAVTASMMSLVAATEYPDSLLTAKHSPLRKGIRVFSASGDADTLRISRGRSTLLMFTRDGSRRSDSVSGLVESVIQTQRTRIVDISLDNDTATWHRSLPDDGQTDPVNRYWVPGATASAGINDLKIWCEPFFVVTDSTARILYRGPAASKARQAVNQAKPQTP